MKFHARKAPEIGKSLYTTRIPNKFTWMRPLVARLGNKLVEEELLPEHEVAQAEVCFTEALTNAIVHGNSNDPQRWVDVRLFKTETEWGLVVQDQGKGFSADDLPDTSSADFAWGEHGRGLLIMAHMMDRVEFYGGGTELMMTKSVAAWNTPVIGEDSSVPLQILSSKDAIVARVALHNIQPSAIDEVFDEILANLEKERNTILVIDFSATSAMSSRTIGRLVSLHVSCQRLGHALALSGMAKPLRGILGAVGLKEVFSIHATTREAMSSLAPQQAAGIGAE